MYDEKKKKDEKKKGMEAMDGMTKTSIKDMKTKPDGCEPEEEEKPDMRSKYTMINLIKNKLRAAGQRDPMIMMKDPVMGEERTPAQAMAKERIAGKKRQEGKKAAETERTPAEGDKSFDIMRPGGKNSQYNADGTKKTKKKVVPGTRVNEIGQMSNEPSEGKFKDDPPPPEAKKPRKPVFSGAKAIIGTPPKKGLRYNPYGKGTANPTNMSGSTGP